MRSIFLFAHPDDEFGCYEVIRREVIVGRDVECFYLTDGGFGGQSIDSRQQETRRVLVRLGVSVDRICFLGAQQGVPDGLLASYLLQAATSLLRATVDREKPTSIFVPAWEGGHQDHDAAHVIGCALANHLNPRANVWQFPLYHGKGLRGSFFRVLNPLVENGPPCVLDVSMLHRLLYLWLCLSYPSQWKSWIGLFPLVASKLLFGGHYYLQRAMSRDIQKPHEGRLLYERRGMANYAEIEALLKRFLAESLELTVDHR